MCLRLAPYANESSEVKRALQRSKRRRRDAGWIMTVFSQERGSLSLSERAKNAILAKRETEERVYSWHAAKIIPRGNALPIRGNAHADVETYSYSR